ncbi:MAG: hypothetical protein MJ202_05590 [Lentisphaeria bacterium]|nr:hypothetical protein [Lentisphaeria bacterium]
MNPLEKEKANPFFRGIRFFSVLCSIFSIQNIRLFHDTTAQRIVIPGRFCAKNSKIASACSELNEKPLEKSLSDFDNEA